MSINKAFRTIVLLLFLFAYAPIAHAAWKGPTEIVSGAWGSRPGQFFFESGETEDAFPTDFGVDNQGRIFINDKYNTRVQVFSSGGSLIYIVSAPQGLAITGGWPYNIYVHPNGSFIGSYERQKFFYDSSRNLIYKANKGNIDGPAYPTTQGYFFATSYTEYPLYSFSGQLISTSNTKPLELGVRNEQSMGGGDYKITMQYPDATYSFVGSYMEYVRDNLGYINAIGIGTVTKINRCGKTIGQMKIPDTVYGEPQIIGKEKIPNYIAEYGSPIIAPNGDVYTWKRTPKK